MTFKNSGMKLEKRLKDIQIAFKIADWFSVDQHIDYDLDLSLGLLFADGRVVFYTDDVLEFTESITPERRRLCRISRRQAKTPRFRPRATLITMIAGFPILN